MTVRRLRLLHIEIDACRACPGVVGPAVHGPPAPSPIFLLGQAPGRHEGRLGRPFAWTAGKALFRWMHEALGISEEDFRAHVYFSAVLRCFPGKAGGAGDRRPAPDEIARCRPFVQREVEICQPELILPVGTLAIEQVLGHKGPLAEVVGRVERVRWHGVEADAIALPHPSGVSTWHRLEPGKTLLRQALARVAEHPTVRRVFGERAAVGAT
jgi:uracil-DNA glycosylase